MWRRGHLRGVTLHIFPGHRARWRPIVGAPSLVGSAVPGRGSFMPSMPLPSRDIRAVYAARRVLHGRFLALYIRPRTGEGLARTAVVAGRRVGTAVDRNRAKRRLRALLDLHGAPEGADTVLVANPSADAVPFARLAQDYQRLKDRLQPTAGRARCRA